MHPILFTIPLIDRPIYTFGLMFALAFFLGSLLLERLARKYGDHPETDPQAFANLSLWLLFGVVIGARLMYCAIHPEEMTATTDGETTSVVGVVWNVISVWKGGLVFYGGFIGAFLIGLFKVKQYKLRTWHTADLVMIAGFFGLGIGRIGCFLIGDDHGRPCAESLPFPIALHVPKPLPLGSLFDPKYEGYTLYATQIWMMVNGFGIAAFGWFIFKNRKFSGQATFIMAAIYSITRFIIEYFRGDDTARGYTETGIMLFGERFKLFTSMKVSIVVLPVSLLMLYWLWQQSKSNPEPDAS
ncbi:MAG: prolipoprotein diacylglyceryl transferase [Planctomycetes bacterium]|nr:prolipoprotein diacylglyceryl transferase [Planctomycetota bacterium]